MTREGEEREATVRPPFQPPPVTMATATPAQAATQTPFYQIYRRSASVVSAAAPLRARGLGPRAAISD